MKTLVVLTGPTGIGKTELSLRLAEHFGCPILNCDSRQLFRGIEIGTAAPTPEEQARVKHYFVGTHDLEDYYSAAEYEKDALKLLEELFKTHDTIIMSGGSMMYIDAVCKGIDDIPTVDTSTRLQLQAELEHKGLEPLLEELQHLDPEYHKIVDHKNTRRIVHALEICRMTGKTFTSFRTRTTAKRPFRIVKIGLERPREELFTRINQRVDQMMRDGLLDEVKRHFSHRHLNSLNTVGYKELFTWIEGQQEGQTQDYLRSSTDKDTYTPRPKGLLLSLDEAVERIKKNTRVYAKKQMTWFAKDTDIRWFHPSQYNEIIKYIND